MKNLDNKLIESKRCKELINIVFAPTNIIENYKVIDSECMSYKMDISNTLPCVDGLNFNKEERVFTEAKASNLATKVSEIDNAKPSENLEYLRRHATILGYFTKMDKKVQGTEKIMNSITDRKCRPFYESLSKRNILFLDVFNGTAEYSYEKKLALISLIKDIRRYFKEVNEGIREPILSNKGEPYKCELIEDIQVVLDRGKIHNILWGIENN